MVHLRGVIICLMTEVSAFSEDIISLSLSGGQTAVSE